MTNPASSSRDSWIERYVLPSPEIFDRPFARALPWLSVCLLFLLVICAIPPVRDYLLESNVSPAARASWKANKTEIVSWIECLRITTEVVIAVAISGQVFSLALKSKLQAWLDQYQNARQNIIEGHLERVADDIRSTAAKLKEELDKPVKFLQWPKHLWLLLRLSKRLYDLVFRDCPKLQRRVVMLSFYSRFPGGLYGLSTYFFFLTLILLKIAKLYMDSPTLG